MKTLTTKPMGTRIVSGSPKKKSNDRLLKEIVGQCNYKIKFKHSAADINWFCSWKYGFQGHFERDWTLPTPFDVFLSKAETISCHIPKENCASVLLCIVLWSMFLKRYREQGHGYIDAIPQLREKEGTKCLLVLGFCPQYREDSWRLKDVPQSLANQISFGDAFTIAIRKLFPTAIFLFSRKECRKTESRC